MSRTDLLASRDAFASALVALREAAPTLPPGLLALADQSAAAAREAQDRFLRDAGGFRHLLGPEPVDATCTDAGALLDGLALFLAAAGQRRVRTCEHLSGNFSPAPSVMVLSLRWWGCADCGPVPTIPGGTAVVVNDDRCDLCDEPPADNRFWPFASTVGSVTVYGEVGSCCLDLMRGAA